MTEAELTQFLGSYGYLAVLIGTFVEGEAILLLAGALAHQGFFWLPFVALFAFLGSFLGDELAFFAGRRYGRKFFDRKPHLRKWIGKVEDLLSRHETLFLIGFRFLYGLRTIAPVLIGIHGVSAKKFIFLNFIGGVVWTILFTVIGYFSGVLFERAFGGMNFGQHKILTALLFLSCAAALLLFIWKVRDLREDK